MLLENHQGPLASSEEKFHSLWVPFDHQWWKLNTKPILGVGV
jgi:hypothetical protein